MSPLLKSILMDSVGVLQGKRLHSVPAGFQTATVFHMAGWWVFFKKSKGWQLGPRVALLMGAMPFKSADVVGAMHFLWCFHGIRPEIITHLYESTYMKICKSGSSVREVTIQWYIRRWKKWSKDNFSYTIWIIRAFCAWQHCRYDMMRTDLPFSFVSLTELPLSCLVHCPWEALGREQEQKRALL